MRNALLEPIAPHQVEEWCESLCDPRPGLKEKSHVIPLGFCKSITLGNRLLPRTILVLSSERAFEGGKGKRRDHGLPLPRHSVWILSSALAFVTVHADLCFPLPRDVSLAEETCSPQQYLAR